MECKAEQTSEIQLKNLETLTFKIRSAQNPFQILKTCNCVIVPLSSRIALLNFGHTLGHAVEKLMNFSLLHGECVSLGIVTACFLSMQLGHITKNEYDSVCDTLKAFHLPVSLPSDALNIEEVVHATKNDKKMDSGKIKFILLDSIGNAYINKELTDDQLTLAVNELLK